MSEKATASIIRKITLKQVCGGVDFDSLIEAPGRSIDLMDVYGIAGKAMPDTSDYGEFLRFKGRFRAVNLATGEVFESGAAILPGVAQDLLGGALAGDEVRDVSFGFRLSVVYNPESVTKYEYKVVSLMEPAKDDPLTMLGNSIGAGKMKALAAPAADPAPADPAPATEKKAGKK